MVLRRSLLTLLLAVSALVVRGQQDTAAMHLYFNDVVVSAESRVISQPDAVGNVSINMSSLSDMPRLGGAVDIVRMLQYTPGVAATQEGSTAMYVRGGDAGQSLMLLDGAPLYSPSHLLGFFSTLNTPHLSGLTLYKSGIPAMYGSSTSSVIDIRTNRYIPEELSVEGNVGLIESDAAIKLPVGERFALFATARHSYASWLAGYINDKATVDYEFGDYGLGFVADLVAVGRLVCNTHFNSDAARAAVRRFNSSCDLGWWNALGTLRLDTQLGESLSMSNMIYGSVYDNMLAPTIVANHYRVQAGVEDYGLKHSVTVALGSVTLSTGVDYACRRVRPQDVVEGGGHTLAAMERSSEVAVYGSVAWPLGAWLRLNMGMRLSLFVADRMWCTPEPRISVELPLSATTRLWVSYNLMAQYLHLVPQSNMSFASDFYLTTSKHIPPQRSHNLSLGYASESTDVGLSWSVEAYYRYMMNVIEYDSRVMDVLFGISDHATMLHSGRGESYGLETSIAYSHRRCDLQVNYTLARSLREFDAINDGEPFYATAHRAHTLTLLASYKPSKRWTLSATFAYASGAPYTVPRSIYITGNVFLPEYGPYNAGRLPAIHHLDISVTYWFKSRHLERHGINLSVYNVYARRNPMMVSTEVNSHDDGRLSVTERHHVVYTIMPSIAWTFKF